MTQDLLETPVLFLVFNRPDTTARVFEEIRRARPARLYVAADGPRPDRPGEKAKTEEVRRIATAVDWPCEVRTLFREENLGCKNAVSGAITWFFEQEAEGIILEDDCLPHPDFFPFCAELLERYRDEPKVMAITGDNFQRGRWRGEGSYYFSKYPHCWGWASWRRAWAHYDGELSFWPEWVQSEEYRVVHPDPLEQRYWARVFDRVRAGEIDTWDYQWSATCNHNGGLTATPNANLVSNIGFGDEGTHTRGSSWISGMPLEPLVKWAHPRSVTQNAEADRFVFDEVFGGKKRRFPYALYYTPRRLGGIAYRRLTGRSRGKVRL